MQVNEITLKNFRNYSNKKFDFDPQLTLITGPNGVGKTNILEAVFVTATGKSQRARYDRDLINYEQQFCSINADVVNQQDNYKLELQILKNGENTHTSTKNAKVNKVAKSITNFTGIFNAVIFIPEDISIITGSPSERRRFLDLILGQTDREYKRSLSSYTKAVQQRNKVLEMINKENRGRNQIGFWNEQIIKFGSIVCEKRTAFINFANENLPGLLHKLDKKTSSAQVIYKHSKVTQERIDKYFENEVYARNTLIGPHREDFEIEFNGHNVAEFGSRGQQRTLLLSLKLLEIDFIEKTKGERPVLLLDDIFSELDDPHRHTILNVIDKQQTIITSAESEQILDISVNKIIHL